MKVKTPGSPQDLDTHPWEGTTVTHHRIGCGAELEIEETDIRVSGTINGHVQRGKVLIVKCAWCHEEFEVYSALPAWLANRILRGDRRPK